MHQLSLFRQPSDKDENLFKKASAIKQDVQTKYLESYENILWQPKKHYITLSFVTQRRTILERSEPAEYEPSSPRFLMRRYESALHIYSTKESGSLDYKFNTVKISPYWAGNYYSDNQIHSYWFVELCRRICSLNYALNWLSHEDNKSLLGDDLQSENKEVLILFDHALATLPQKPLDNAVPDNERSRLSGLLNRLVRFIYSNGWFLAGYSRYFRNEDLINDLNKQHSTSDYNIFGNDYVLLNNAEFPWEESNTDQWPYLVLPPKVAFEGSFDKMTPYFYCKPTLDGHFFRFDLRGNRLDSINYIDISAYCKDFLAINH